jgi:hypothetical protein
MLLASATIDVASAAIVLFGAWLVVQPAGWLVGSIIESRRRAMASLPPADAKDANSTTQYHKQPHIETWTSGSRLIGWLERFLVFMFVLSDDMTAVGFLIAAKGTFRLVGLDGMVLRDEAEKVFIGSLLSFAVAILISMGTRYLAFAN